MVIKQNALDIHFSFRPNENELAKLLDEAFDISYGAQLTAGRSLWIAEPKRNVKDRFGLEREVLVIYSAHTNTDARTLTAIDQIFKDPEYKHRLDKAFVILIHNGDVGEANEIAQSDTDRIIITFHAEELRNPQRGSVYIRQKFAARTEDIDLFGRSSAISVDRDFFGRNGTVQALLVKITSQFENGGLFGLRKTGKTSVLKAIQRKISERSIVAEYIDCSNPGIHSARWWDALEDLTSRIYSKARTKNNKIKESEFNYTQQTAGSRFSRDIKALVEGYGVAQIVIMLDEIEYITPGISGALGQHWDKDFVPFWQTVRSVHQELNGKLTFVVAGVNPACVQEPRVDNVPNPIFQLVQPLYLEPFDTPSIREMVRTIGRYAGTKFDEDVYSYLCETYGGHPFLIRVACSEVWRSTDRRSVTEAAQITINDFKYQATKISARLSDPIRDILLSLVWWYPEEYDLLQILAGGDEGFFRDYLQQSSSKVIKFAHYGILCPDLSGKFAIADLRKYIVEHGEEYKRAISPFIRSDMPPELLPAVPNLEVLAELFKKKCELEINLRRAIVVYLGVLCNWDNAKIAAAMSKGLTGKRERTNPENLFTGRAPQEVINELYTVDLKTIVATNWQSFAPLFDSNQARFEMNMDSINKARRYDSHTKPISQRELDEFNNSYEWMLTRLSRVPSFGV